MDKIRNPKERNIYVRSDLACETGRIPYENCKGAFYERIEKACVTVERLEITDKYAENETGKKIGTYVTVSGEALKKDIGKDNDLCDILCSEITSLTEKAIGGAVAKNTKALIVGIGNKNITPDALGPMSADKISPTRHLMNVKSFDFLDCSEISVIKTSVLGQTGIESAEIIKGVCDRTDPDVIIAIDSLAARSVSRLASTVQLSNVGISPGTGIGNTRKSIDKNSMGRPVISIGVPTVVDCATLIYDSLEEAGIEEISDDLSAILERSKHCFVTPKECDITNERLSGIISKAISDAFNCFIL